MSSFTSDKYGWGEAPGREAMGDDSLSLQWLLFIAVRSWETDTTLYRWLFRKRLSALHTQYRASSIKVCWLGAQCKILTRIVIITHPIISTGKAKGSVVHLVIPQMRWLVFFPSFGLPLWHMLLLSGLSRRQFLVAAVRFYNVYRRAVAARPGQIPGTGNIRNVYKIITANCLQRKALTV